ncbi:MAG: hypothetical protein K9K32_03890 [Halanaerobiales bacterium]|nr:hypothetical protein [Halanaerobiales bacterium]
MLNKIITSEEIAVIDILEIESTKQTLWKKDIYTEEGMVCKGIVVLIVEQVI